MKWEELKVYRPLSKEELKPAFKDFTNLVANHLKAFGFSLYGRKLIAVSNDVLHIIHVDTRGTWSGVSDHFKTEISIVAISDKSPFFRGFELTGSRKIENIAGGIRDYYRMTQEYALLADFLTRKIIERVFPYFKRYDSSAKILADRQAFKLGDFIERNDDLIIFCELQSGKCIEAGKMIDKTLSTYYSRYPSGSQPSEYLQELEVYKKALETNDWATIDKKLESNKREVLKKMKIKIAGSLDTSQ